MLKQVFCLFVLSFAIIGMAGQSMANGMDCTSHTENGTSNAEMSDCSEMNMAGTADDSKKSKNCCGSDCTAMMQCSQSTATFLGSTAFAETIAVKAMSHALRPLGKPAGMHSIPEIKPPITV